MTASAISALSLPSPEIGRLNRSSPVAVQDLLDLILSTRRRELDDARLRGHPDCAERCFVFGERDQSCLDAFGRAVALRARRAGFFGRPRPILKASSRRCSV